MATVCYINVYNSNVDRGAVVTTVPREHYEVDEEQIKVGKPLPKFKCGNPIVKAYDGQQLTLDVRGKAITIKVGEEVEVYSLRHEVGMGVYSRTCYYVKLLSTDLVYKGGWQFGDTIRQELAGPIGQGEVHYPNGDTFKGTFHLSYASINGPAYAAEGRYTFADGSYIERAWIHTSEKRKAQRWGLHGVFRIHHPEGADSIAMFCAGGKRNGFELFLPEKSWEKPWVREWYAGDRIVRYFGPDDELFQYEVEDCEIDETSRVDCTTLKLTLKDGKDIYRIEQQGGGYSENSYGSYYYEPSTHASVDLPNGDRLEHYGDDVRSFKPYDGYVEVHCAATGMYRKEHWKEGTLVDDQEWKRDVRAAQSVELPDPFDGEGTKKANVWKDGHIEYNYVEWIYDGEMASGLPEGKGVLVGGRYNNEGQRYEGEFHAGRCHGQGTFTNEQAGIRQEGMWVDGVYQEPKAATAPIILHARHGHKSWSVGHDGDWEYEEDDVEVKLGSGFGFIGQLEVARIEEGCITLLRNGKACLLTPGETLKFYEEVEGREWSDGCVYDGDDYTIELTWNKK